MDIVLSTRPDKLRLPLLKQTLQTLFRNSILRPLSLTIVEDSSGLEEDVQAIVQEIGLRFLVDIHLMFNTRQRGVGGSKNVGAAAARPSADGILMFLDDDTYLLPSWDYALQYALLNAGRLQVSGWSHPFNLLRDPLSLTPSISIGDVEACHGGCQVLRWETWREFGPFDSNCVGVGQSEDWALSQRIRQSGNRIGCVTPFVAINCGLTTVEGKPSVGHDEMLSLAKRQIGQLGLKDVVLG